MMGEEGRRREKERMWTERERETAIIVSHCYIIHPSSWNVCVHVCACACTCVHMSTCKKLTCFPLLIHTELGHMLTQLLLSSLVILHFPLSLTPSPTPPTHVSPPPPPNQDFSRHLRRKTVGQHICVLTSLRDPLHFPVKFL